MYVQMKWNDVSGERKIFGDRGVILLMEQICLGNHFFGFSMTSHH